jgi:hypothetical protein
LLASSLERRGEACATLNQQATPMHEVKFQRIPIQFGQTLWEHPDMRALRRKGWTLKWASLVTQDGRRYAEALMERTQ